MGAGGSVVEGQLVESGDENAPRRRQVGGSETIRLGSGGGFPVVRNLETVWVFGGVEEKGEVFWGRNTLSVDPGKKKHIRVSSTGVLWASGGDFGCGLAWESLPAAP